MLWGHIILALLCSSNNKLTILIGFTLVLLFTELIPFTLITYNMIMRLQLYRKAQRALSQYSMSS